jgi:hypothetical protein
MGLVEQAVKGFAVPNNGELCIRLRSHLLDHHEARRPCRCNGIRLTAGIAISHPAVS